MPSLKIHRFIALSAVFLFIFLMGIQTGLSETYRVYGVRSNDVLNIRSKPSVRGQRIGTIPPNGRGIQVLGTCSSGWCPIQYRTVLGWVSAKFLTREASVNTPYRVTGIANWDVLYIRSQPSTRGRKIGSIPPQGRDISKLGPCSGNWCKIDYQGIIGWASMMYLVADTSSAMSETYIAKPSADAPIVSPSPPAGRVYQRPATRVASLLASSKYFQTAAAKNFARTLLALSKEKGKTQLYSIDKALWGRKSSQLGWMTFFNSAIPIYSKDPNGLPLVGYYNPYSDTFLITVWTQHKAIYKIVDAEMVMGDFVRGSSQPPSRVPLWTRKKQNYQAALGTGVAHSVMAFEDVFAGATYKNWRDKLKLLRMKAVLKDHNYPNISVMTSGHLLGLLNFTNMPGAAPKVEKCRNMAFEFIRQEAAGKSGQIFNAVATPVETADLLKALPQNWFKDLRVSAAGTGSKGCLVVMTPTKQTGWSIVFSMNGTNSSNLYIHRIDLLNYQQFYDLLKSELRKQGRSLR